MSKEKILEEAVATTLELEHRLEELEQSLSEDPKFREFLAKQKEASQHIADSWKDIEEAMIQNKVKSIKGDWGSITIAERLNWKIDPELLPSKFIKKVPDTTKISTIFKLEGKAPKGCEPTYTKYLTKRIK